MGVENTVCLSGHCEERIDEAIQAASQRDSGLGYRVYLVYFVYLVLYVYFSLFSLSKSVLVR